MEIINHKAVHLSGTKTIRLKEIYWLAMILPHVDDDRELGNVIDDFEDEIHCIARAFGFCLDDGSVFEQILDKRLFGFLAKVERPVMDRGCYTWGHYEAMWIYAENIEALLLEVEGVSRFLGGRNK